MQDQSAFSVISFSDANLVLSLSSDTCRAEEISTNQRVQYLVGYLEELKARTIVCEHIYVDHDYLDDYASFYAKSFEFTSSRCRRVHFFAADFDAKSFERILGSASIAELTDSYLGFIVARPLATAVIGRTVLKVYPSDGSRRFYPCVRPYRVNLFGIPLMVDGLAFQEQDTSLAACATVALWSCFQMTQKLFSSEAPSPASITRSANRLLLAARPFPSRSLQIQQVCNAIAAVGLDPEVYEVNPTLPLATLIYSHLSLGLPVIAIVGIPETGLHAIAINGYSIQNDPCLTSEGADVAQLLPNLVGLRINEFYGHDDQTGPHCRLKIVEPLLTSSNKEERVIRLNEIGGWRGKNLIPLALIVPVYPKIRIGFREVLKWLPPVATALSWCQNASSFEWDIKLAESNSYKTALRTDESVTSEVKLRVLPLNLPKYIWVCLVSSNHLAAFEMLLDSTSMVNGYPIVRMRFLDQALADKLSESLESIDANLPTMFADSRPERFIPMLKAAAKAPYASS